MDRIINDFFLNKKDFIKMRQAFIDSTIPWFPSSVVQPPYFETLCEDRYNLQFTHIFYDSTHPFQSSQHIAILNPLIEALNIELLIRIKANLNPCNNNILTHGYHRDLEGLQEELKPFCRTAVFYLNTNNGYTVFEDGTKIESIENRLVTFNSQESHSGTTCTDQPYRILLNINYIPHKIGVQQ